MKDPLNRVVKSGADAGIGTCLARYANLKKHHVFMMRRHYVLQASVLGSGYVGMRSRLYSSIIAALFSIVGVSLVRRLIRREDHGEDTEVG